MHQEIRKHVQVEVTTPYLVAMEPTRCHLVSGSYEEFTQPLLSTCPSLQTFPNVFCINKGPDNYTSVTRYFLLPVSHSLYLSGVPLYDVPSFCPPNMSFKNKEVLPSAPPLDLLNQVIGYESASYDAATVTPPHFPQEFFSGPSEIKKTFDSMGEGEYVTFECGWRNLKSFQTDYQLTEDEARSLLYEFAASHCCYGNSAARNMSLTRINYSSAFCYTLETFTEKRQMAYAFEPYNGETLDTSENGTPPQVWEINVSQPELFKNNVQFIEVPHTASVITCHQCNSSGKIKDTVCHGDGTIPCIHCHGDGHRAGSSGYREPCNFCHGKGHDECSTCGGSGMQICKSCSGKGQLKCYIRLTVKWSNNVSEHIAEKVNLPDKIFRRISGKTVYHEKQPIVFPINHFPNNEINMASFQLITDHERRFAKERILMQRHHVSLIPINEISYKWKGHQGKFYICGDEKEVYAPDYPQSCCWGLGNCSIF